MRFAALRPRTASGRSKSACESVAQSDFAWRISNSRCLLIQSIENNLRTRACQVRNARVAAPMNHHTNEPFAAVDLGSNSFHMIVANYADGRLQVVDRLREMVQLATGLDENNLLDGEAVERALQCLQRFGQRIREIPKTNVRAVGTNTIRQARNGNQFLTKANRALGHRIEVIAGREEARLVFLGVAHTVYDAAEKRLVVDIGGGSTELVIGRGFDPYYTESLYMGCVNMSRRFFEDGEITLKRMRKAVLFARQELEAAESTYRKVGWDSAMGSSGTILSVNDVVRARGWSDSGITPASLEKLRDYLVEAGHVDAIALDALADRRKPVFCGGVAILSAVLEGLGIDRMRVSEGALREGLLYDLIGRAYDQDVRDRTVADLAQRYAVDGEQSARVANMAEMLFMQVATPWRLDPVGDLKLLRWAAQMHEIGLAIAHAQYHRHGAYLLSYSDMPGFSRPEQFMLATLVRAHRRKFPTDEFAQTPEEERPRLLKLAVLLRLAVVLNRSRSYAALPDIRAEAGDTALELAFPRNWLGSHPLTQTDLDLERELLVPAGFTLSFR